MWAKCLNRPFSHESGPRDDEHMNPHSTPSPIRKTCIKMTMRFDVTATRRPVTSRVGKPVLARMKPYQPAPTSALARRAGQPLCKPAVGTSTVKHRITTGHSNSPKRQKEVFKQIPVHADSGHGKTPSPRPGEWVQKRGPPARWSTSSAPATSVKFGHPPQHGGP